MTRIKPSTSWNSERYETFIEDINGNNLSDIEDINLLGITGAGVNILETDWELPRKFGDGLWKETILPWKVDFFPWLFGNIVESEWDKRNRPNTNWN